MRYIITTIAAICMACDCIFASDIELRSATMIGGDYAVRLVYSTNVKIDNFTTGSFYATATVDDPFTSGSSIDETYRSCFAYVDAQNPRAVIVTFNRRVVNWIEWGVCTEAKNTKLYYNGSWIKSADGNCAPAITGKTPKRMEIYNNSATAYYQYGRENAQLMVEGVPVCTSFTDNMWAYNYQEGNYNNKKYYVNGSSANASDDNDGTDESRPLKTIAAGVSKLSAGTTLVIAPGIYRETLNINTLHGTADAPIVIEGLSQKDSTFISAAKVITSAWSSEGSGIFSTPFTAYDEVEAKSGLTELGKRRENLFVDHYKYGQVLTLDELRGYPTGTYCVTDGKIYAKFPSDFTPSAHLIEVNTADGINLQATNTEYLAMRNLHFIQAGNSINTANSQDNTIFNSLEYSNNIILDNCSFDYSNNMGLSVRGHDIVVRNCSFNHNGGTGLQINHNGMTNVNEDGNTANYNIVVEGCNLTGNNWRMGGYGGIYSTATAALNSGTWINGIVRSSRFDSTYGPAIWMDIHHSNIAISHNSFNGNGIGVWLEIGHGSFNIVNNLFTNNNSGILFGHSQNAHIEGNFFSGTKENNIGFAWLGGDGDSREECHKTVDIDFVNNIVVADDKNIAYFPVLIPQSDDNTWDFSSFYNTAFFKNNTYCCSTAKPFIGYNSSTPFSFDEWRDMMPNDSNEVGSIVLSTSPFLQDTNGNWSVSAPTTAMGDKWNFTKLNVDNSNNATLSNTDSRLTYRYTVDGHLPTETSPIFNGTVNLSDGNVLEVIGFGDGVFSMPLSYTAASALSAINTVNAELPEGGDKHIYTLSGIRLDENGNLHKGIYIKGGKKIIIK